MIGDILHVKPHHVPPARKISDHILTEIGSSQKAYTLTVGGESGSGKSTLSLAIKQVLAEDGHECFIFHMDDYFHLPPKDNHDRRVTDINKVGPGEVNLELLQEHLDKVQQGTDRLRKPLVHYRENLMREVIVELEDVDVVIAEGTYVTLLEHINCKIFMLRNYEDTYHARIARARDPIIPFNEEVLKIEHEIIQQHKELADILVDQDYNVKINNP